MADPEISLARLTQDLIVDLWKLKKDRYGSWCFPKESNLAAKFEFYESTIHVGGFSNIFPDLRFESDKVLWGDGLVLEAADPKFFDMVVGLIAHVMGFSSMGWDDADKVKAYTDKCIKEAIKRRKHEANQGMGPSKSKHKSHRKTNL